MRVFHIAAILLFTFVHFAYAQNKDNARLEKDRLNGVYLPKDIEDGFLTDSTKMEIKQWKEEEFCSNAHFGLGMWMRNNWGLWGGSRLSKYFNEMKIFHPDDMSSIILTSYHCYLTGNEIKLEEQIKYCKKSWKKK